jgi:two-component system response regulator
MIFDLGAGFQQRLEIAMETEITLVMVDDNADEIFLTRRLVRGSGIVNNFVSEKKPERLFEALSELRDLGVGPDKIVVLMDVSMPRSDGFETLRRLRTSDLYRAVPVIMLSASSDAADIDRAMALGANGYMVKPFDGDDFFAALNSVAKVRHKLVKAA